MAMRIAGRSRLIAVRRASCGLALLGIGLSTAAAYAADTKRFDLPPGALGAALIAFGQQSGFDIGVTDSTIAGLRTRGLRGRYTPDEALARLLAGTGCGFSVVDSQTVRIVRLPDRPPPVRRRREPSAPAAVARVDPSDIVVVASKQASNLADFPGSVLFLSLDNDSIAGRTSHGSDAVLSRFPQISSTNLGPGRNKLFIRGIADSSFSGPTQATVGQYLGDVRLTYNAPDPDLNLYDVEQVEVLEGPQNTLYGTGALGGVFRIIPRAPSLDGVAASFAGGFTTTAHGGDGYDAAGMINLPVSKTIALRAVAYAVRDPGYIDDPGRGIADINRTSSYGGRGELRITPGDDWTIDVGGALQNIGMRDGQYAIRGLPPLTRLSTLAQPFDNDYALAHVTVRKRWDDLELVSATGYVDQDVTTRFDATGSDGTADPRLYVEDSRISLFSHETRLSGKRSNGAGWVAGLALVSASEEIRRMLGDPASPAPITGVRNDNVEAAVFGRFAVPLASRLTATFGGRVTYANASGNLLDSPKDDRRVRHSWSVSPSVALSWKPSRDLVFFAGYDEGQRAGGLAVSKSGSTETTRRFVSDSMSAVQGGLRFRRAGVDRLSGSVTASYTRWEDIQADLIDTAGLPYTANIGSGRIEGIEGQFQWMPLSGLSLGVALFFNNSRLTDPAAGITKEGDIHLPNVAQLGARGNLSYRTRLGESLTLALDASVQHTGRSRLGPPPDLYIAQGRYWDADLGARLEYGRFGLSLDLTNLLDTRGNRFSYGNPFTVMLGNQTTPLRPRSLRLGVDAKF